jgi:hypothetical protein
MSSSLLVFNRVFMHPGGSYYIPYSFVLISNKFFIGSMPFHRAQKTLEFQALPILTCSALVMHLHAAKTLCTGLYK